MTNTVLAKANPEKRLFISLLTRDISMVAAFLDLIDNSVNAALEPLTNRLETADGYADILEDETVQPRTNIWLTLSDKKVIIADNAPGIPLSTAQRHVFKFGRSEEEESESDRLSVYGLGLKRAFFKLGNRIKIESDHMEGGFELDLDVAKWARDAELPWQFELTRREPVAAERCGTKIKVWHLHEEAKMRLGDGQFEGHLKDAISKTYSYFLSKFVRIFVNKDLGVCAVGRLAPRKTGDVLPKVQPGIPDGISGNGRFQIPAFARFSIVRVRVLSRFPGINPPVAFASA